MSEHENDKPEFVDGLPEGTELAASADEFQKAIAMQVDSPLDALGIGIGLIDTGYGALKGLVGPFGEMAALQAITSALLNNPEDGLRIAIIRAAIIAEALEGEESPTEIASKIAERFGYVEEQTDFAQAREAWQAIKGATEESAAEVDALEAAFQLPDADEPEIDDEKGETT